MLSSASDEVTSVDPAKMLFDLPPTALSPAHVGSWAKALNQRNFQDKLVRIFQYGGRGLAYYLSQTDPKAALVIKVTALYKQISLSRKAFRCSQSISHVHTSSQFLKALLKDPSDEKAGVKALSFVQWALFAIFIFWDNMTFLTHPSVGMIDQPKSLWFNHAAVRQTMINSRARSDLFAFAAALLDHILAGRKRNRAKEKSRSLPAGDSGALDASSALATAEAKYRESRYPLVKYLADVATYLPQASWSAAGPWHTTRGWHDGYIGAMGVIAALCSCRAEWIKLK